MSRGTRQRNPRKATEKPEQLKEQNSGTLGRQRRSRRDPRNEAAKPEEGSGGAKRPEENSGEAGGTRGREQRNLGEAAEEPDGPEEQSSRTRGSQR